MTELNLTDHMTSVAAAYIENNNRTFLLKECSYIGVNKKEATGYIKYNYKTSAQIDDSGEDDRMTFNVIINLTPNCYHVVITYKYQVPGMVYKHAEGNQVIRVELHEMLSVGIYKSCRKLYAAIFGNN